MTPFHLVTEAPAQSLRPVVEAATRAILALFSWLGRLAEPAPPSIATLSDRQLADVGLRREHTPERRRFLITDV
ncbi:MAG: hypothetical protein AAGD34_18485 [Pseudomonadota bacterium]